MKNGDNKYKLTIEEQYAIDTLMNRQSIDSKSCDLNIVIDFAKKNGLAPLMYKSVLANPNEFNSEFKSTLKKEYLTSVFRNTRIETVWQELLQLFNTHHLDYIPLKGIFLSQYIYNDISARPMSDIDVLLKPQDAELTYRLLIKMGAITSEPDYKENVDTTDHHLPGLSYKGVLIEIHRNITPDDTRYAFDAKSLWNNTVVYKGIKTLEPNLNLIYLCIHLYTTIQRGGIRLSWFMDFIIFSQSEHFKANSPQFMTILHRLQMIAPVLTVLRTTEWLFGYQFSFIDDDIVIDPKVELNKNKLIHFLHHDDQEKSYYGYNIALERIKNTKGFAQKWQFIKNRITKDKANIGGIIKRGFKLIYRLCVMIIQRLIDRIKF